MERFQLASSAEKQWQSFRTALYPYLRESRPGDGLHSVACLCCRYPQAASFLLHSFPSVSGRSPENACSGMRQADDYYGSQDACLLRQRGK